MLVALPDLHRAMQGLHAEQVLQWMTDVSGLPIRLIGHLYAMEPPPRGAARSAGGAADAGNADTGVGGRSAER
jgi:hypothetical protein